MKDAWIKLDFLNFVDGVDGEQPKPRKAPTPTEQLTERIQIKITKAEMETLKKKIGLVPVSKWLRNELKGQGVI